MSDPKLSLVIFDWAGTTIDYGCMAPINAFKHAFSSFGADPQTNSGGIQITDHMARKPMGLLKRDHIKAIAQMLPEHKFTEGDLDRIYGAFEHHLMADLKNHCDVIPGVLELTQWLRDNNIKIGSTTGYTKSMMETVSQEAKAKGYEPDFVIASDEVAMGRPHPYMVWHNFEYFKLTNPRHALKVGDTVVDIEEGSRAGLWTAAVLRGSSELGFTEDQVRELENRDPIALERALEATRRRFYEAGADFIIDDISHVKQVVQTINSRLAENQPYKLLTPGPLTTKKAVKQAMLTDHCTWDNAYKQITKEIMGAITQIAVPSSLPSNENPSDYETVLLQGSGSYAVEAMLTSLTEKSETLLVLSNGEYGKRMGTILKRANRTFMFRSYDSTRAIEAGDLHTLLEENEHIQGITLVHCETTTGVINHIEPLMEVVEAFRRRGRKLTVLLDAMSTFGAYPIDLEKMGIDAMASSANKCLEGLPGISFVVARRDLFEASAANGHSHSLDLYDQYVSLSLGGGKFRFTSPTHVVLALQEALDQLALEGGTRARFARYQENHQTLMKGMVDLGYRSIVEAQDQSCIITTFELGDLDFGQFYQGLKAKGFVIYPGKMTDIDTFRIGNIGDIHVSDLSKLLEAIGDARGL